MSEFKKLFDNLQMPEPDIGFEQRIIEKSFASAKLAENRYVYRKIFVAAMLAVVVFASTITLSRNSADSDYAYLVTNTEVVSNADIYDDLIQLSYAE